MDTSLVLYNKILQMPEEVKDQVNDFIDFIISRKELKKDELDHSGKSTNDKRPFGILKGKIKMADDFDEPLDDFKDYM